MIFRGKLKRLHGKPPLETLVIGEPVHSSTFTHSFHFSTMNLSLSLKSWITSLA